MLLVWLIVNFLLLIGSLFIFIFGIYEMDIIFVGIALVILLVAGFISDFIKKETHKLKNN